MFIGHFAPAFVARGITKDAPKLGVLFIAAQLVDWAFFTLAIVGVEKLRIVPGITAMSPLDLYHMPYTHSLLASAIWALGFAAIVWLVSHSMGAATWAGVVVVSHWLLDLLVHRPDLTIAGGDYRLGLGLWNSPALAMPVELILVLGAYWFYIARTKGPLVPPLVLLATMLLLQGYDWFGPEPVAVGPGFSIMALLAFGLLTTMAFWVQSTRWHKNTVGLAVAG